jgi:hypothetical protein
MKINELFSKNVELLSKLNKNDNAIEKLDEENISLKFEIEELNNLNSNENY